MGILFALFSFYLIYVTWEWICQSSDRRRTEKARQKALRSHGEVIWQGDVIAAGNGDGKCAQDNDVMTLTVACLTTFLQSELVAQIKKTPLTLRIAYAVLPGQRSRLEVIVSPGSRQSSVKALLTKWMADWPALPVIEPLVLSIKAHIRGGVLGHVPFPPVFQDLDVNASRFSAGFGSTSAAPASTSQVLVQLLREQLGAEPTGEPIRLEAKHLDACVQKLPDHYEVLMTRGIWRARRDQFAAAIEDLEKGLSLDPSNASAHYWRAICRANLGQFDLAQQDAERAEQLMPEVWAARNLMIRISCQQDRPEQALEVAAKAIERHPHVPNLYYSRALAYLQKQSYSDAEADLTRALQLAPEWPEALYQRALTRFKLKQSERGMADLESWESLQPPTWSARRERCVTLIEFSQWAPAATLAADDSRTNSVQERCDRLTLLGFCLSNQGKFEMAIQQQTAALELDPTCLQARALRAIALIQTDAVDEALLDADAALAGGIASARMRWVRAMGRWTMDDRQGAIDEMARAVEQDPDDDFCRYWYARFLSRDEQMESARDILKSFKPENEDIDVRFLRGSIQAYLGNWDAAWKDLSLAAAEQHCPPEVLLNRAKVALERGDLDLAELDLSRLLAADEENFAALVMRGQVRSRRKRPDLAILDYLRAEQAGPPPVELGQLLLGALITQRKFADARTKVEEYHARYPDLPWDWIAADLEVKEHGPGAGDELLRTVVSEFPEQANRLTVDLLISEAEWEAEAGHYEAAAAKYTEALDHDPDRWIQILWLRSTSYWYAGQFLEAIDDLNRLMESDLPKSALLAARGQLLCEQGEYEQALADFDSIAGAWEGEGESVNLARLLNGRGRALAGLGRFDEAWEDLERSIGLAPDNAWVHFTTGWVYTQQGRPDWARHCFALSLHCHSPALPPLRREKVERLLQRKVQVMTGDEAGLS